MQFLTYFLPILRGKTKEEGKKSLKMFPSLQNFIALRIVTELCVDTLQVGICSIAYKTSQCLSWVEFVFLDVDPS